MSYNSENKTSSKYVIKGTPVTDPYTGKPRLVIEEEKHYDIPLGFALALMSFLVCVYSIVRGNIVAILITVLLTVGFFLLGVYSLTDGNPKDFKKGLAVSLALLLFAICGILMVIAVFAALIFIFHLITLI